ncbi:unnamed protein product, partial [Rotaria sordida]
IFKPLAPDTPDEVVKGEDATATITINLTQSNDQTIKKARPPLLKSKTITTTNLFDSFDSDLTRVLHRLETSLSKPTLDPKGFNTLISSIDSQFADIRLMINSE